MSLPFFGRPAPSIRHFVEKPAGLLYLTGNQMCVLAWHMQLVGGWQLL